MDFKRKEGESERGYYCRVAQELKFGVRKRSEALLDYKAGRASVRALEEDLVGRFSAPEAVSAPAAEIVTPEPSEDLAPEAA